MTPVSPHREEPASTLALGQTHCLSRGTLPRDTLQDPNAEKEETSTPSSIQLQRWRFYPKHTGSSKRGRCRQRS